MKKVKSLIMLSLTMMIVLTGCSDKKSELDVSDKKEIQEEIQIPTEEGDLLVDIKSNSEILHCYGYF